MYYRFESAPTLVAFDGGAVAGGAADAYASAVCGDDAHDVVLFESPFDAHDTHGKYADALAAAYGLGSARIDDDGALGEAFAAGDPPFYGR